MKRLTALLSALLLAVLLVSGAAEPADTPEPEKADPAVQGEEVTVAESGNLRLSVNLSTCAVALWNGADGSRWDTNPVDPQEDAYTGGAVLNDIRSQLVVTYYDHQKNTATIGSYLASVLRRSFEIRKIADGVRVTYNFSRETEQFSIPLEYRLRDGALDIRIPVKDIKERGEARISEIQVLPYFLRGGNGEEGYLLIPDGSGALIDFSVPRPHAAPYKQKVYGRDLATSYIVYIPADRYRPYCGKGLELQRIPGGQRPGRDAGLCAMHSPTRSRARRLWGHGGPVPGLSHQGRGADTAAGGRTPGRRGGVLR